MMLFKLDFISTADLTTEDSCLRFYGNDLERFKMLHSSRRYGCLFLLVFCAMFATSLAADYCAFETFEATCREPDEVILMTSARYGRMRFGGCVREHHGNEGCSSDVMPYMDSMCSGRHRCNVSVLDKYLHRNQPCPQELMAYLEVSYQCVQVEGGRRRWQECGLTRVPWTSDENTGPSTGLLIDKDSGYLSSVTPKKSIVGTYQCPWILKAPSGHRINLTIIGFHSWFKSPSMSICVQPSVVIEEVNRTMTISPCSTNGHRLIKSYQSTGHFVKVFISDLTSKGRHSNLKYQWDEYLIRFYQVYVCSDSMSGEIGSFRNSKCNKTDTLPQSICIESSATGVQRNCTTVGLTPQVQWNISSYGGLIFVGLVVALSVASGVLFLFIFLQCIRRRKKNSGGGSLLELFSLLDVIVSRDDEVPKTDRIEKSNVQDSAANDRNLCGYRKLTKKRPRPPTRRQLHPPRLLPPPPPPLPLPPPPGKNESGKCRENEELTCGKVSSLSL